MAIASRARAVLKYFSGSRSMIHTLVTRPFNAAPKCWSNHTEAILKKNEIPLPMSQRPSNVFRQVREFMEAKSFLQQEGQCHHQEGPLLP